MFKNAYTFARNHYEKVVLGTVAAAGSVLSVASPSHAAGDIDDLFLALNIAGLSTNIKTLLIAGVGITLLFLGYRYLKRASSSF